MRTLVSEKDIELWRGVAKGISSLQKDGWAVRIIFLFYVWFGITIMVVPLVLVDLVVMTVSQEQSMSFLVSTSPIVILVVFILATLVGLARLGGWKDQ